MVEKDFLEKANDLLSKSPIVVLASLTDEGCPRPVPLAKLKENGVNEIWVSTSTSSAKVKHFEANPKAGLAFYNSFDSVALTGTVEILTDAATKESLWQDWLIDHFPLGVEDSEFTILKFTARTIGGWIDSEYVNNESL